METTTVKVLCLSDSWGGWWWPKAGLAPNPQLQTSCQSNRPLSVFMRTSTVLCKNQTAIIICIYRLHCVVHWCGLRNYCDWQAPIVFTSLLCSRPEERNVWNLHTQLEYLYRRRAAAIVIFLFFIFSGSCSAELTTDSRHTRRTRLAI